MLEKAPIAELMLVNGQDDQGGSCGKCLFFGRVEIGFNAEANGRMVREEGKAFHPAFQNAIHHVFVSDVEFVRCFFLTQRRKEKRNREIGETNVFSRRFVSRTPNSFGG